MPWNLRRDLHLDINAGYGRVLLTSAQDSSLLQPPPDFVAGDGMPVRLYFWERGPNGTLIIADPGPDTVLILSGRPADVPPGSALLFLTNDFTEISTGVWEGTLDLTPTEFSAHLAELPAGAKTIRGEVEVRNSVTNSRRISFQFDLTARPEVYANDGTPLALPTPEAWLAAQNVEMKANKGQPNGYAPLDAGGKVPASNLPGMDVIPFVPGVAQVMRISVGAEPGGVIIDGVINISVTAAGVNYGQLLLLQPPISGGSQAELIALAVANALGEVTDFDALWSTVVTPLEAGVYFQIEFTRRVASAHDSTFVIDVASERGIIGGSSGMAVAGVAPRFAGLADTAANADSASGLKTATTTVSVSNATAPTSGQVLTATSGTVATWQIPSGGAAGTLTGATLAGNVLSSSLTSTGTLTGGATGAGFTVALGTATITGTIPTANTAALTGDVTKAAGSSVTTLTNQKLDAVSGLVSVAPTTTLAVTSAHRGNVIDSIGDFTLTMPSPAGLNGMRIYPKTFGSITLAGVSVYTEDGGVQTQITAAMGQCILEVRAGNWVLIRGGMVALTGDVTKPSGSSVTTLANIPAISGANLTALNGSSITTGTVPIARLVNTQVVGDAPATFSTLVRDVILTTALTLPRSYTLPAANSYPAGARVSFSDIIGTLTSTNTATLLRAASDTINGATSLVLSTTNASVMLISDGASKWNVDIRGVSRGGTGSTSGSITGTGALVFTAGGTNQNITLAPSGTGRVTQTTGSSQVWSFGPNPSDPYAWTIRLNGTDKFSLNNSGNLNLSSYSVMGQAFASGGFGSLALASNTLAVTGDVSLGKTVTAAGTTGAQSVSKTTGRVNFAAAAVSLVVTNALCTVNSIIQCTIATNDATAAAVKAVAGAGSFTIYLGTAPTAETAVNFTLTN